MYFNLLLQGGFAAVLVAAAHPASPAWPVPFVAAVVLVALLAIQRRVPDMARAQQDARLAFGLLVCLQWAIVAVGCVLYPCLGLLLLLAGGTCNVTVILANGARMPVTGEIEENPCYRDTDDGTRLAWLGDIFDATPTASGCWAFSFGDILEIIGMWVFAAQLWLARCQ